MHDENCKEQALTINDVSMGMHLRDVITGFSGYVTAKIDYITGCSQVCLQPQADEKGEKKEPHYVDVTRCVVASDRVLSLPHAEPEPEKPDTDKGDPQAGCPGVSLQLSDKKQAQYRCTKCGLVFRHLCLANDGLE